MIESLKNSIGKIKLFFKFKGFKKAGTEAFDVDICIIFSFKDFVYNIIFEDKNYTIKKLYHQLPTTSEIETFAKIIGNAIYDEIELKLSQKER